MTPRRECEPGGGVAFALQRVPWPAREGRASPEGIYVSEPRPKLQDALEAVRLAYARFLSREPNPALRTTDEELFAQLPDGLADEDGRIALDDGSVLHLIPERGDRSDPTGRLGVVQRFPDGRPEQLHLVTA